MKKSSKSFYGLPLCTILYLLSSTIDTGTLMAGMFQVPPQATVTGTITDIDGLSLPGVHVQVGSTEKGTISDLDGFFEVQAETDDVLVFTIVGFKSLSLTIRGRQHLNVILEQDVTQLGEVILNAGYYKEKERERRGRMHQSRRSGEIPSGSRQIAREALPSEALSGTSHI